MNTLSESSMGSTSRESLLRINPDQAFGTCFDRFEHLLPPPRPWKACAMALAYAGVTFAGKVMKECQS